MHYIRTIVKLCRLNVNILFKWREETDYIAFVTNRCSLWRNKPSSAVVKYYFAFLPKPFRREEYSSVVRERCVWRLVSMHAIPRRGTLFWYSVFQIPSPFLQWRLRLVLMKHCACDVFCYSTFDDNGSIGSNYCCWPIYIQSSEQIDD